ncbi:Hpt domain-containing protein [Spongiivirga citrea]|uniref:Hpt domain-containing protein n=1 Tax=Spongiivirga citrea TaxID=1481457 RepID=A0A6M0CMV2_9FLAO|nr:Hpt domain-containing protein [Spongiivirga citrea]NER17364.1 Hpt domain-containing protein [Spongiivirga citrea]
MKETPNLNYVNELAAGDSSIKTKLISIMKKEFPEERAEFMLYMQSANYTKASEQVHKLKHKINILGLQEGYVLAKSFENDLKKNIISLNKGFSKLLDTIENYLNTL